MLHSSHDLIKASYMYEYVLIVASTNSFHPHDCYWWKWWSWPALWTCCGRLKENLRERQPPGLRRFRRRRRGRVVRKERRCEKKSVLCAGAVLQSIMASSLAREEKKNTFFRVNFFFLKFLFVHNLGKSGQKPKRKKTIKNPETCIEK